MRYSASSGEKPRSRKTFPQFAIEANEQNLDRLEIQLAKMV
jgi:hypothetical protein